MVIITDLLLVKRLKFVYPSIDFVARWIDDQHTRAPHVLVDQPDPHNRHFVLPLIVPVTVSGEEKWICPCFPGGRAAAGHATSCSARCRRVCVAPPPDEPAARRGATCSARHELVGYPPRSRLPRHSVATSPLRWFFCPDRPAPLPSHIQVIDSAAHSLLIHPPIGLPDLCDCTEVGDRTSRVRVGPIFSRLGVQDSNGKVAIVFVIYYIHFSVCFVINSGRAVEWQDSLVNLVSGRVVFDCLIAFSMSVFLCVVVIFFIFFLCKFVIYALDSVP